MRQSTAKRNLSETSFGMIEPQKSSEPDKGIRLQGRKVPGMPTVRTAARVNFNPNGSVSGFPDNSPAKKATTT
jgi:hypothetical protein